MAEATAAPYGRKTASTTAASPSSPRPPGAPDGLSCDGDTVSITAATQPSLEDVVMGAIPGLPKVHLHNRVLDYSLGGEEYLRASGTTPRKARLEAPPFIPGGGRLQFPMRSIKQEGYWAAADGHRLTSPVSSLTLNSWIDRLLPRGRWQSSPPAPALPMAASTRWPATPPAAWAFADYLGWGWLLQGRHPDRQCSRLSGTARTI